MRAAAHYDAYLDVLKCFARIATIPEGSDNFVSVEFNPSGISIATDEPRGLFRVPAIAQPIGIFLTIPSQHSNNIRHHFPPIVSPSGGCQFELWISGALRSPSSNAAWMPLRTAASAARSPWSAWPMKLAAS